MFNSLVFDRQGTKNKKYFDQTLTVIFYIIDKLGTGTPTAGSLILLRRELAILHLGCTVRSAIGKFLSVQRVVW
jgi:hypothetical protein